MSLSRIAGSNEYGNKSSADELGISVSSITPKIAEKLKLPDNYGVIVENVEPDSKGDKAGIAEEDIVREINHHPVKTVSD